MAFLKKYIGDKAFYKKVLSLSLPIILQQFLLNTFSMVDSIMVGSIYRGVAGVGIGSQLSMIIMTVVFGINSGMGIYLAQFYGAKDEKNLKNTFALGFTLVAIFVALTSVLIIIFPTFFVNIFNQDPEVVKQAVDYIQIAAFSYLPNALTFVFAVAYRNIQKTKIPLFISFVSSGLNILLNYLLIFGIGPFPEMGVKGAALATVISVVAGFIVHLIYALVTNQKFMAKIANLKEAITTKFMKPLLKRVAPLIFNELLFSIGTSIYVIFINNLGSDAYEGYRIAENINNIVISLVVGLSISVAALIGEALGQKDMERADKYGNWFLLLGAGLAVFIGIVNFTLAPFLVKLFNNPSALVELNGIRVLRVYSLRLMLRVFIVIMYSTFRAGGESKYVAFLDSGILWLIGIPVALLATKVFQIQDVAIFYLILQVEGIARIIIGMPRYQKRTWINNLTDEVTKIDPKS